MRLVLTLLAIHEALLFLFYSENPPTFTSLFLGVILICLVDMTLLLIFRAIFGIPLSVKHTPLAAKRMCIIVVLSSIIHWITEYICTMIAKACMDFLGKRYLLIFFPMLLRMMEVMISLALFDYDYIQQNHEYCTKSFRKYFQGLYPLKYLIWDSSRMREIPYSLFIRYLYSTYIKVMYIFKSKYLLELKLCQSIKRI